MVNSIADLLQKERFDEPEEIRIIKSFVMKTFNQVVNVNIQQTQIIILVKSSSLAGALRSHLHVLQEICKTDKRLVIRISV